MSIRALPTVALLLSLLSVTAEAQNSVYGVAGIGFPGRGLSVRSMGTAGAMGIHDRSSALNPAATGAFGALAAGFSSATSNRNYTIGTVEVDGLRDTRFPNAFVGTRIGESRTSLSAGFSQYMDRSFDITTSDSVVIRGERIGVEDRIISNGGITDFRMSASRQMRRTLWLGAGVHLIGGSTRSTITRTFGNQRFSPFRQVADVEYSGLGGSVGFVYLPTAALQIAGSARYDTELGIEVDSIETAEIDLPVSLSGGFMFQPSTSFRVVSTLIWRSWSGANDDVVANGLGRAFDTWDLAAGVEAGGAGPRLIDLPVRVGFRYATLPFSPDGDQPSEVNLSIGTALRFAQNRASLDVALTRSLRDGGGAEERAWVLSLGLEVRP